MDDLMKLDAASFRRKYAIVPERPIGVEAPPSADPDQASPEQGPPASPPADPLGAWRDRLRESEGGAAWTPAETRKPTDPDIGWDEWGQR
jgi:hypothetical protein